LGALLLRGGQGRGRDGRVGEGRGGEGKGEERREEEGRGGKGKRKGPCPPVFGGILRLWITIALLHCLFFVCTSWA